MKLSEMNELAAAFCHGKCQMLDFQASLACPEVPGRH